VSDKPKISRVEVYWHTVKYRTMLLYAVLIGTIVLTCAYMIFPEVSAGMIHRLSDTLTPRGGGVATPSARQARFINLDGRCR